MLLLRGHIRPCRQSEISHCRNLFSSHRELGNCESALGSSWYARMQQALQQLAACH